MNIKSIYKTLLSDKSQGGLLNLFQPTIRGGLAEYDADFAFREYVVTRDDEMRIDLVMKNIYGLSYFEAMDVYQHCDVLLTINNIDNPLNLKEGMIIKYPNSIENLEAFRIEVTQERSLMKNKITAKIGVPNKQTRKDSARDAYVKNGLALPPTVLDKPRPPVRLSESRFSVGGL